MDLMTLIICLKKYLVKQMKNNTLLKYSYLFLTNFFKINRYKFLKYDILLKNYRFNKFIKSVSKKYGKFRKIKYPKNLSSFKVREISKNSFKQSEHLKEVTNSTFFFYELNSFFNNDYFICLNSTISKKLLDSFHLFPPNIFVLEEIFNLKQNNEIGKNLIVDFPCGITNLFQYLSVIYDDELLIGIDNFTQISYEDVKKYQENLKEFEIYENIENPKFTNNKIDVVVTISIEIKEITEQILQLNPSFIFLGSSDLNHDISNLEEFLNSYKIREINHAFILLENKN